MTPSGPKRALVVDDDPHVCALIRDELTGQGFKCLAATDSHRAKELLDRQPFDAMVADIAMPGADGLDLLAYARRVAPNCKVILITGFSNRDRLAQALLLGAYDYLEKPLDSDELVAAVARAASGDGALPQLHAKAAAALELDPQTNRVSLDTVRALVRAVEAKDPHTRRHSEQVAHYAVNLARLLGLPDGPTESMRAASLLHDVGKIGVPDHILTKSGKLTDEEFEHIRRHPALGAEILANMTLFRREARFVRHHHEAWDGSGYPDGLAGEEIPLAARILHVADAMDDMLMARSYKQAYSVEKMLGELERCAGTQFDPEVAAAAIRWCEANPDKLIRPGSPARPAASLSA